ncbi:Gfo/Idh/MocA family protein [Ascidiimonas sp. W6]|uniref:Gfo/Idh/MocA family protein n=1 Tax=Ascidiimonas meishanensis TaxID=3128903 RepID=UPI0030EBF73B
MSKQTQVNWGILGAGKIARKFAQDLVRVSDAKLMAVAARNGTDAKKFASEFHIENAYNGYEAMLMNSELDIVYIATPHVFHCEHVLLCITYKKAVLCEKPFAMNTAEVQKMILAAKENNVLLMEALWTAFLPHYQYTQNFLKKNTFGRIKKLEADFGFPANPDPSLRLYNKSLGGGSLLDIGIYPVFAALSTLGIPKSIKAEATFTATGVDAACTIEFTYSNETIAVLKSTFQEETPTTATFYCENGTLKIKSRFHEPSEVLLINSAGEEETISFNYQTNGYSFEAAHMNLLYKSGVTESPIMNFETSLNLMKLLDDIRKKIGLSYT